MGKSMKKTPVCKQTSSPYSRWAKRQASKAVRRFINEPSRGCWYRKVYCSWNICDYRSYQTLREAIFEWETDKRWILAHSKREVIQGWSKYYKRK